MLCYKAQAWFEGDLLDVVSHLSKKGFCILMKIFFLLADLNFDLQNCFFFPFKQAVSMFIFVQHPLFNTSTLNNPYFKTVSCHLFIKPSVWTLTCEEDWGLAMLALLVLATIFRIIAMLLGNKPYTVRKPVYFYFNWSHICKDHAFVGWAAELSVGVTSHEKICQIFSAYAKQLILLLPLNLVWSILFLHDKSNLLHTPQSEDRTPPDTNTWMSTWMQDYWKYCLFIIHPAGSWPGQALPSFA